MKKTNKIISIILAMILAFSSLPLMASASAIDDKVDTVDKLIQGDNLGNLVEWLLKNLNERKEKITPTILRLVFMLVEDESLKTTIGDTDIMSATDEQLAKILIDWLNVNLPEWTKDIYKEEFVAWLIKDVVNIDLSTVNGVVKGLYDLAATSVLGDISSMKEDALKNVSVEKSGNLNTVYALLQFLSDNTSFIKKVLKAEIGLGIGFLFNSTVNNLIKDNISPAKIREMLCDVLELVYMMGDLNGDEKITAADARSVLRYSVELETFTNKQLAAADINADNKISALDARKILRASVELEKLPDIAASYSSYTADELIATAFLKLLTNKTGISKEEAGEVMSLSIYQFLETYAGSIYANLLLDILNNDIKAVVKDLAEQDTTGTLKTVLNLDYEFKADTFDAYLGAGKGNMVNQLNNAVITLIKVILNEDAFNSLGLEEGGNDKLNSNLSKAFRYILPLIKDIPDLGADLSGFTNEAVASMDAEEMAVAVLKLFFKGWFDLSNEQMADVDKATTLEQLAVLAAYYAVSNKEWVPMTITAADDVKNVETLTNEECLALIFEIGMETAAKALEYNKSTTYFELPADTSAWTADDYLDDIADWAINLISGLPVAADSLTTERGVLDGNGGFYKLNVILNALFDLSFITGCGNSEFAFDIETMLMDKFLGNLLDFDIEASVAILAENEDSSIFNKKINEAAIDIIDDLLTGLFEK